MANLTEYLTAKYTKIITEMSADLGAQLDRATEFQTMIQALKNHDIMFNGGPLTLDRIQVMEDGGIRIKPMPPVSEDTCIEEISKEFWKNGKRTETAVAELAEVVNDPA